MSCQLLTFPTRLIIDYEECSKYFALLLHMCDVCCGKTAANTLVPIFLWRYTYCVYQVWWRMVHYFMLCEWRTTEMITTSVPKSDICAIIQFRTWKCSWTQGSLSFVGSVQKSECYNTIYTVYKQQWISGPGTFSSMRNWMTACMSDLGTDIGTIAMVFYSHNTK